MFGKKPRPSDAKAPQSAITETAPCQKSIRLQVARETLMPVRSAVVGEFQKRATLSGFRKGKAPPELVARHYAKDIQEETIHRATKEALEGIVKAHDLKPVGPFELRKVEMNETEGLTLEAIVEVEPSFSLATYTKIPLTRPSADVTPHDVDQALERLRASMANLAPGKEGEKKEPQLPALDDQLAKDLQGDLIVPVLFGSAELSNGITRLWKALRHEAPQPAATAERLGIPAGEGPAASVFRILHLPHTGRMTLARVWRGPLSDGMTIGGERVSGLFHVMGGDNQKIDKAGEGEVVALGRMEQTQAGDLLTPAGRVTDSGMLWPDRPKPVFALAVQPLNRQDDVKLTGSVAKLIEEDGSISVEHNADTHQMLLWGQGEIHLKIATERLKSKFNVAVEVAQPQTAYKETIRKSTQQHARFKRQTGGHGQFGDVQVEIRPLPRGQGFEFIDKVVGGSVPRQYISAVEHGAKDYLQRGPLGFPVVDLSVTLFDGQHHAVDSSDQAFKTAGRMAMSEGLPNCAPVLLEPIYQVTINVPSDFTAKIHGLISGRRGQILGFESKAGWDGWDEVKCQMPQSELKDLIIELRSLTFGVGSFVWNFDHLQELTGRQADKVIKDRQEALAAD
ncbi:MAG: elongation factor G [Proteobacteria bacterium]|nr:elongation factor G [Pseudomonadota bacterium]